ncbi:MAG: hypothetical protein IT305_27275 [Chloroflexi bacterium]|nr:hypothetical protein [Chloroflexota bacterium]
MGTRRHQPRVDGHVGWYVAAGLSFTLVSYLVTFFIVREYYRIHLPHYDSIGHYGQAFGLINQMEAGQVGAALHEASQTSIGWLQPFYVIVLAWLPIRAPEYLVSLNYVLLIVAQLAIVTFARTFGYGPRRTLLLMLLPFVPGAMYAWDGGMEDLRRDAQYVILLIACLFASLAYVCQPSTRRAIGLGLLAGLTQWSRDNALAILAIVVMPAAVVAISTAVKTRHLSSLLKLAWLPLATFVLVVAPYFWFTLPSTIARYRTEVWGPGEDRLASLAVFWTSPADVLFGGTTRFNGKPDVAFGTSVLLLGGLAVLAIALGCRYLRVEPRRLLRRDGRLLLAAGSWIVMGVIAYNSLLLGYGAQYHGMPYVPTSVGIIALFAGLGTALVRGSRTVSTGALGVLLAVGMLGLLSADVYRIQAARFSPAGAAEVEQARAAALSIADTAKGRPVALLWIHGYGRYHVNFYLSEGGRSPLALFDSVDRVQAARISLERPWFKEEPEDAWRGRLLDALQKYAAIILVAEDPNRYADPTIAQALMQLGKPVVANMLADPQFRPIGRYEIGGVRFVLLENERLR